MAVALPRVYGADRGCLLSLTSSSRVRAPAQHTISPTDPMDDIDLDFLKILAIVLGLLLAPPLGLAWLSTSAQVQEIRSSCGIERTTLQMFLARDTILELCKMRQQQLGITINEQAPDIKNR
jgi:hypothetical protein